MFVFRNPCARAELHQQKRKWKLCSATLNQSVCVLSLCCFLNKKNKQTNPNLQCSDQWKNKHTCEQNRLIWFIKFWAVLFSRWAWVQGIYLCSCSPPYPRAFDPLINCPQSGEFAIFSFFFFFANNTTSGIDWCIRKVML